MNKYYFLWPILYGTICLLCNLKLNLKTLNLGCEKYMHILNIFPWNFSMLYRNKIPADYK